ncbi:MAG: tRNA pseudouridine(38-40) synthase TruA [Proteobacteria bacterium]|nr:tRNA pseudouridine(38-40) synthase TruA [Pseudomonadota bacterium]
MLRTIRLLIAYDGSGYHGWQRQRQGETTIQEELETRLSALCQQQITLHGAGRTDAGVHALGMVAHFHTASAIPLAAFTKGLNSLLPPDIRILGAEEAPPNFHSRFSAVGKTYRYSFFTGPVQLPGNRCYQAHYPGLFDPKLLEPALAVLVGTHDFSSFERSGSRDKEATDGRGAVRTLTRISCVPVLGRPDHWSIRFTGDGFLRQMVRILTGTLIEIGQGKRQPDEIAAILAAKNRAAAGPTAPACGLLLEEIHYHPQIFCPPSPCSKPAAP